MKSCKECKGSLIKDGKLFICKQCGRVYDKKGRRV